MQLIFDVIQYFSNLVSRNNFGDEAEQAHRERERGPWIVKVWILTLLSGCFPDACKLFQEIWCYVNLTLSCYRVFDPLHPNIDMFILRFTWYWQGEFV